MQVINSKMPKPKLEDRAYQNNSEFWTEKGDNLTVMGDYLGRLPSVDLIDVRRGEVILDAGCGAGFISRRLAKKEAWVHGCDRNKKMLTQAKAEEDPCYSRIEYTKADITKLPYNNSAFDKVACIAVLIHDSPKECGQFFDEAKRVLKPNGKLFVSIMHPYLYQPQAPTRNSRASWAQYTPVDNLPMTESQRFREDYRDSHGHIFSSVVWYHPEEAIVNLLNKSGLTPTHSQSKYVTKEVLAACNQTGDVGFPAFWQIVAEKK